MKSAVVIRSLAGDAGVDRVSSPPNELMACVVNIFNEKAYNFREYSLYINLGILVNKGRKGIHIMLSGGQETVVMFPVNFEKLLGFVRGFKDLDAMVDGYGFVFFAVDNQHRAFNFFDVFEDIVVEARKQAGGHAGKGVCGGTGRGGECRFEDKPPGRVLTAQPGCDGAAE